MNRIALNLREMDAVFLDGDKTVFKGLEFFHFLGHDPHFDGIAAYPRKAIVQHRIATKIEGRIAPLGCQFVAFSAGIVL